MLLKNKKRIRFDSKMSTEKVFIKLEKNLANKVLVIASKRFPLRNIDKYAEAVREALIEFIKNSERLLEKKTEIPPSIENHEEVVSTQ